VLLDGRRWGNGDGDGDTGPGAGPAALPWALTAAAIAAQVAYPLMPAGRPRDRLTVASVLLFGAASVSHAAVTRGPGAALALLAVAGGGGLAAEAAGTATGVPFGRYSYADTLGPRVLGVPVVIPLAWAMMAYPAVLAAREVTAGAAWARWPAATTALAGWDLFLDPQMVDAGHWRWQDVGATLPGIPEVPLSNFAGWVGVSAALTGVLDLLLPEPRRGGDDLAPHVLLLWTWAGSTLAHGVFWKRPAVAAWGGAVLGLVAVPLARSRWRAWREHRSSRRRAT
jgi:uncharacterized membrane protein